MIERWIVGLGGGLHSPGTFLVFHVLGTINVCLWPSDEMIVMPGDKHDETS